MPDDGVPLADDFWTVAGRRFRSRLVVGTGRYKDLDETARAIEAIYGVNTLIHGTQLPHIARSVLREIVERDAISLLGLGVPPVPNPRDTTRALATDAPLRFGGETG